MHSRDNTAVKEPALGLADRAVGVARALRATCTSEFRRRHDSPEQWSRWARRARVARTVAAALQLPTHSVTVTDDPDRQYRTRNGNVPGDLITVTPFWKRSGAVPDLSGTAPVACSVGLTGAEPAMP